MLPKNLKRIVVFIPAHNEEDSIADTIESVLAQSLPAHRIVVIANGCVDRTVEIANGYKSYDNVRVMNLPQLPHRKSEALNIAWNKYGNKKKVFMVVSMDADTRLPENALKNWFNELSEDPSVGGSSSKFTILEPKGLLPRLQKAEFAAWTDINLQRGSTTVLSGTGCAIRNDALRLVAMRDDRKGPWAYTSQVEDFELTYRIQELGYETIVSPTVRAYTDSMKTVKALWGQRMKWQVGTLEDLLAIGWNEHTRISWGRQMLSLLGVVSFFAWIVILSDILMTYQVKFEPLWLVVPLAVTLHRLHSAFRIPFYDKWDILLSVSFFPSEAFILFRYALFIVGWFEIIKAKITKKKKDRWAIQYSSEGA